MKKIIPFAVIGASLALSGCMSTSISSADADKLTADVIKTSFQDKGIAKVSRLEQDEANRLCSAADVAGKPLDAATAKAIEAAQMKTIKWPSDGAFLGDFKAGEKVAQGGRGLTWSDKAEQVNGGNCYNCHQIDPKEISYGNIGPSLTGYGKMRGYSQEVVTYTWNRINNSKAYNACSNMPRMQHFNLLTEQQIKDVMALLLDPASPVNQ